MADGCKHRKVKVTRFYVTNVEETIVAHRYERLRRRVQVNRAYYPIEFHCESCGANRRHGRGTKSMPKWCERALAVADYGCSLEEMAEGREFVAGDAGAEERR